MNLLQVRTQFRSVSGRFDLVNSDFSDNGADFYINAGQRHLDRLGKNQKSFASCYRFCEAGFWTVQFPYCRAIQEVWAATITARWQLEKRDLQDLLEGYFTTIPSGIDTGNTLYYAPAVTRMSPGSSTVTVDTIEAFVGYMDTMSGDHYEYNSILMAPPPDERLMIEIKGLFYSEKLEEDTDKSYWSEVHPDILIMAAMRHLEIVNRNTQGKRDWDDAIASELFEVDKDLVEEEIAEITQIED